MKNCAWRLGTKYGVAYIEDNGLASELLEMEGIRSKPSDVAMATYYSPRGKAYAWQVKFDVDRWDKVARKLGLPVEEKVAQIKPKPKLKTPSKAKPKSTTRTKAPTTAKAKSTPAASPKIPVPAKPKATAQVKPKTASATKAKAKAEAKPKTAAKQRRPASTASAASTSRSAPKTSVRRTSTAKRAK